MKKKINIFLLIILFTVQFNSVAFAESSSKYWRLKDTYSVSYGQDGQVNEYTLDEIIQKYKLNSAEYTKINLTQEINSLYFSQLELKLNTLDENIDDYNNLIIQNNALAEQYRQEADSYEEGSEEWTKAIENMEQCLSNVSTYRRLLSESIAQKANTYTEYENYKFICNHSDELRIIEQRKLTDSIKESCLYLVLLNESIQNAIDNSEYNDMLHQIIETNFDNGRATKIDIGLQEAALAIANNQKTSIMTTYNNKFREILRIVGINEEQKVKISIDLKQLRIPSLKDFDTVKSLFYENDIKEKRLINNITTFEGKIEIIDDIYPSDSDIIRLENKNKDIAVLEHMQWLTERASLLKSLYADYEKKYYDVKYKENAASAQYRKYEVSVKKYSLGLISGIQLQEEKLKLNQLVLDAYTALFDYIKANNAIELAMLGMI